MIAPQQGIITEKYVKIAEINSSVIPDGKLSGALAYNIVIAGCDYNCVWCNTYATAVDKEYILKAAPMLSKNVLRYVQSLKQHSKWINITGGNPLLYDLTYLIEKLRSNNYLVRIETQASIYAHYVNRADLICISPKPPSALLSIPIRRKQIENIDRFINSCLTEIELKIPVFNDRDLEFSIKARNKWYDYELTLAVGYDAMKDDLTSYLKRYQWLINEAKKCIELTGVRVCIELDTIAYGLGYQQVKF